MSDKTELEELLGQYWDLAFNEAAGISGGSAANEVLSAIRALFARRATIQPTAGEMVYQFRSDDGQPWSETSAAHIATFFASRGWQTRTLYTWPVAPADAVRDAKRYRWLTEVKGLRFSPSGGSAIRDLEEMNKHIDAAILATKSTPKEPAK